MKPMLIVVMVFLFTPPLFGLDHDFDSIRKNTQDIQTLSGRFTQKKHLKLLSAPLISRGVFFFQAPQSVRWEYKTPLVSVLLARNGRVQRFFKEKGEFVKDSAANLQVMRVVIDNITQWISGRFDQNPDFKASFERGKIILIPTSKISPFISRVELRLSQKPGLIDSISIIETKDSYTVIEFTDLKQDLSINPSVFEKVQ